MLITVTRLTILVGYATVATVAGLWLTLYLVVVFDYNPYAADNWLILAAGLIQIPTIATLLTVLVMMRDIEHAHDEQVHRLVTEVRGLTTSDD